MRYGVITCLCLFIFSCQSWFGESKETLFSSNKAVDEKDAEEGARCGGIMDIKCKADLFCKMEGGVADGVGICVPRMPFCSDPGGRSEGWVIDGELKWDVCSTKAVGCSGIGSRTEGWYGVEVRSPGLIVFSKCSKDLSMMPRCVPTDTKIEVWKFSSTGAKVDRCSTKIAVCYGIGTKEEGWYAQEKVDPVLLKPDRCFIDKK